MNDMHYWNEGTINDSIYYDPGKSIILHRKVHGGENIEKVKVIETYPRFVLVEDRNKIRFTVLKKELFFKEAVEW